jgi:hypothetical protein
MTTQDFSGLAFHKWSYLPWWTCWQAFARKRFMNLLNIWVRLTHSSPWSCHSLGGYIVFTMLRPGFSCKAKNMEVKWTIQHCEKLLSKHFSFPILVIILSVGHVVYYHPWLDSESAQPAWYCDGFAKALLGNGSVSMFQHTRHATIWWKCFLCVYAWTVAIQCMPGDVTQQWVAITWCASCDACLCRGYITRFPE